MRALSEIGGEAELVALEYWAQSAAEELRNDENGRKRLQQNRDAIQKRVEEERKKAAGPPAVPGQLDPIVPSAQEVRKTLADLSGEVPKIVALGEQVYPAFEAILSDPAVTTSEALQVFEQLVYMAGDRSRFAPYVVRQLAAYRPRLLWLIRLLGDIGSRRDTAPLVALLYDSNPIVVRDALAALGKLGGEREQVAIDIWLKSKAADLHAAEQARAAIRKRVEEEKKRKN
jgi:HEAT repeat protein